MARTQRNKATANHLGILKARLAKLRRELIQPKGGGGGAGEGFDVAKTGDARIGFVGMCTLVNVFPLELPPVAEVVSCIVPRLTTHFSYYK